MGLKRIWSLGLAAVLGLALGLGGDLLTARASVGAAPIGLGSSAADLLGVHGNPAKINYGPDQQTWFYADRSGVVEPRFDLNQSVVVRVRW